MDLELMWLDKIEEKVKEIEATLDTTIASSDGLPLGPPIWEEFEELESLVDVYENMGDSLEVIRRIRDRLT